MQNSSYPTLPHSIIALLFIQNIFFAQTCRLTRSHFALQLFRQRLSHKSVTAYATMPNGLMGTKGLALID